MRIKTISLGLVLAYPVFVLLRPSLADPSGVALAPTLLLVSACIGVGIFIADSISDTCRSVSDAVSGVWRGIPRFRRALFSPGIPVVDEQYDRFMPPASDSAQIPVAAVAADNSARCEFIRHRIEDVIARAVVGEATGMHITIRSDSALLEHVAYGTRREVDKLPPEVAREIVGALFEIDACANSNIRIDDVKAPIEMSSVYTLGDRRVHVHGFLVSIHPEGTLHATLDLRYAALSGIPPIEELGYSPKQLDVLRQSLESHTGLTLFAGPSGCGASTTLASMVCQLPRNEVTYTIENPISYDIPGVSQVDISSMSGEKCLGEMSRIVLNGAPRNIMLYEINKTEFAAMVTDGVRSGARVFSYIQADSALGALNRLLDFGISKDVLAESEFLLSVIYQRLVPVLCPHCSVPVIGNLTAMDGRRHGLSSRIVTVFDGELDGVRYRGLGCPFCKGHGAVRRTVVAETIQMDKETRKLIRAGNFGKLEDHMHASGWQPLRAHVLDKVKTGQVCPADAEVFVLGTLVNEQNAFALAS